MSVGIKTTWGMYLKCRFLGSSPGPTEPDFPGLTLESFFFFLKIQKMLTYLTIGLHIEKAGGIPFRPPPFFKCEGRETVQLSTKIKSAWGFSVHNYCHHLWWLIPSSSFHFNDKIYRMWNMPKTHC